MPLQVIESHSKTRVTQENSGEIKSHNGAAHPSFRSRRPQAGPASRRYHPVNQATDSMIMARTVTKVARFRSNMPSLKRLNIEPSVGNKCLRCADVVPWPPSHHRVAQRSHSLNRPALPAPAARKVAQHTPRSHDGATSQS